MKIRVFTTLLLIVGLCADVSANSKALVWDEQSAHRAAAAVPAEQLARELFSLTLTGQTGFILEKLNETSTRDDWPLPAREAVLLAYVQQLRTVPAHAVPSEVMDYLAAYQPQTLIQSLDHPGYTVPMFNIRSAASGVMNDWKRQEATLEGIALLRSNPRSLVDAFVLEQHPAVRLGYLNALPSGNPEQVRQLQDDALGRLAASPELTPLAGQAALLVRDEAAVASVLSQGDGYALAHLMRESARLFDERQLAGLLETVLASGSTHTAALAITELGVASLDSDVTRALLFNTLDHPELGSSAALALARDDSSDTKKALSKLASHGEGLVSARARSALAAAQTDSPGEARQ